MVNLKVLVALLVVLSTILTCALMWVCRKRCRDTVQVVDLTYSPPYYQGKPASAPPKMEPPEDMPA